MMGVTHILVGLAVTLPLTLLGPWAFEPVAMGAILGGAFPDLDLLVGSHRRTFHYPVFGPMVALVAVIGALIVPTPATVGLAATLVAAGVHAASDVLGAGNELRPWERTNTDAVYDHLRGRWIRARYVVRYDGSPEDLLLAVIAAIPVVVVQGNTVRWGVVVLVLVGTIYTLLRKRLVKYFARIV
jgi:hypothetical protein